MMYVCASAMFPDYLALLPTLLVGALKHYTIANTRCLQRSSTFVIKLFKLQRRSRNLFNFMLWQDLGRLGGSEHVTLPNVMSAERFQLSWRGMLRDSNKAKYSSWCCKAACFSYCTISRFNNALCFPLIIVVPWTWSIPRALILYCCYHGSNLTRYCCHLLLCFCCIHHKSIVYFLHWTLV